MQIIGHRGARGEAPENTLGGFRYLRDIGIRAVEFDVRQLTDQCLVVMHDDDFLRTCGQSHSLYACQQEQLAQFNQAQHWQSWPQQECTPILRDVLTLLHDFAHIEVEIKAVETLDAAQALLLPLLELLKELQPNATITSFDPKIHQVLQRLDHEFQQGLLVELPVGLYAIEFAKSLGCTRIGWKDDLLSYDLCQASLDAGLLVSVWTVNDVARAEQLKSWGIQGLITDIPLTMQRHFSA